MNEPEGDWRTTCGAWPVPDPVTPRALPVHDYLPPATDDLPLPNPVRARIPSWVVLLTVVLLSAAVILTLLALLALALDQRASEPLSWRDEAAEDAAAPWAVDDGAGGVRHDEHLSNTDTAVGKRLPQGAAP
jgi:hypothetical protein